MGADNTHHNAHLKPANLVHGPRMGVVPQTLEEVLPIGITWKDILDEGPMNYGNTRKTDLQVVGAFFKNGFNTLQTGCELGYNGGHGAASNAVCFRVRRINTRSLLDIARRLIKIGLLSNKTISETLSLAVLPRKTAAQSATVRSKNYRFYCRLLVTEAMTKWANAKDRTAAKLGVTVEVVDYWLGTPYDDDFMAKPTPSRRAAAE